MQVTEIFWVSFVAAVCALLLKISAFCYKSKCDRVECYPFLKIIRNTNTEEHIDEHNIDHGHTAEQLQL